jgi:hypothetical protein
MPQHAGLSRTHFNDRFVGLKFDDQLPIVKPSAGLTVPFEHPDFIDARDGCRYGQLIDHV